MPSPDTAHQTAEGDNTPRSKSTTERTADEAMAERGPPERPRALNASGLRGGEGRRGTPTQQRAPTACSEGEGGDPREDQRGNPPRGGPQDPEGGPQRAHGARGTHAGKTATRRPPERQPAHNVSDRRGGEGGGEPPNQQHMPEAHISGTGGSPPSTHHRQPPGRRGLGQGRGPPAPAARANRARAGGGGDRPCAPTARGQSQGEGRDPPGTAACAPSARHPM